MKFMKILLRLVFIIITVSTIWMLSFGLISSRFLEPLLFPEKRLDPRLATDIYFKHGSYINFENLKIPKLGKTNENEMLLAIKVMPFAKLTFLTPLPKEVNGEIVNIDRIYIFIDNEEKERSNNIKIEKSISFFVSNNTIVDYTIVYTKIKNYNSQEIVYSNKVLQKDDRLGYWHNSQIDLSCYLAQLPDDRLGVGKKKSNECPYSQFYIENGINLDSWDRKLYNAFIYIIIYPFFFLFL